MSGIRARIRFRWSIATVLTSGMVLVIILLMATTTVLDVRRSRAIFRDEVEERGQLLAGTLNDVLADPLYYFDVDALEDIAQVVASQKDVRYVSVFRVDGRLLVHTDQPTYPVGEETDELVLKSIRSMQSIVTENPEGVEIATPIEVGSQVLGGVRIAYSSESMDSEISALTRTRVWQSAALALAGAVLSLLVAQYFVRPLRRLVRAAEGMAEGRFELVPRERRADEIGDLSQAFADMATSLHASQAALEDRAARLKTANERLRREISERKMAEFALQDAHDELDARVKERTVDLSHANEALEQEVTQRTRAQERIRASLEEKEVLLKEINHRVKNNLQLVSSLLSLQAVSIEDDHARDALRESQSRVRSMALIHQSLYGSDDLARIDFGKYVNDLGTNLFLAYNVGHDRIGSIIQVDDISLDVDTAIPCGLIINELVSNSLKHAFPDGMRGEITVELRRPDRDYVSLTVSDNGVGLPAGLDFRETDSLGLQLVNILTQQLGGTVELRNGKGARFEVTFPVASLAASSVEEAPA